MSAPYDGISTTKGKPGISGTNDKGGDGVVGTGHRGVVGESVEYQGVYGHSTTNAGVVGVSRDFHGVYGESHGVHSGALFGTNDKGGFGVIGLGLIGVSGEATSGGLQGVGVKGVSLGGDGVFGKGHRGVRGESDDYQGVSGWSSKNAGVVGESQNFHAVYGVSHSVHSGALFGTNEAGGFGVIGLGLIGVSGEATSGGLQGVGIKGVSLGGDGVFGKGHRGVRGESDDYQGVSGWSSKNAGVVGESVHQSGVWAISHDQQNAGLFATNDGGGPAAFFGGDVVVTRHITANGDIFCDAGDCAEDFDIADVGGSQPGTVMVLGADGALYPSESAYDKRVVGVVSGAGDYRPAIVLDKRRSATERKPIALLGKVFCKADASSAPIGVGDLLTTSDVPGHAMKAVDPATAFGAVIGKALRPLAVGQGLIPILVTLQ